MRGSPPSGPLPPGERGVRAVPASVRERGLLGVRCKRPDLLVCHPVSCCTSALSCPHLGCGFVIVVSEGGCQIFDLSGRTL